MKIIELHVPDDVARHLPPEKKKVEQNIIDFLRSQYMSEERLSPIERQYKQAAKENGGSLSDFSAIDGEGWGNDY